MEKKICEALARAVEKGDVSGANVLILKDGKEKTAPLCLPAGESSG